MKHTKVYKLWGYYYEIKEDPFVYSSKQAAFEAAKRWENFLDMSVDHALRLGYLEIQEWTLVT